MSKPGGRHYDDESHAYTLDRIRIPSVTEALVLDGRIDKRFYNPEAADRGRRVHFVTEQTDIYAGRHPNKNLLPSCVDIQTSDIEGEALAYEKFCAECRPRFRTIERPFWNRERKIGGRPDRTLRELLDLVGGVLEVKTGTPQEWHGEQTAGYVSLEPKRAGGPRWVLYLFPTGRYKLELFKDADDHRKFETARLAAHKHYQLTRVPGW